MLMPKQRDYILFPMAWLSWLVEQIDFAIEVAIENAEYTLEDPDVVAALTSDLRDLRQLRRQITGQLEPAREESREECAHPYQYVNDRSQFVCCDCGEELGR